MKVDTQWFRFRLQDRRMTQRQLASLMKMDPASVSLMLRGQRRMQLMEAERMAYFLNVGVEEVLFHAGVRSIHGGLTDHPIGRR